MMKDELAGKTIPRIITLMGVNSYLLSINNEFVLIDTGWTRKRKDFEKELEDGGCKPGDLKLIVITHGDFDHIGNCAYLRDKYGAKIVMHELDAGMARRGDMFWNRDTNIIVKTAVRIVLSLIRWNLKKADRFEPDLIIKNEEDLSEFGFNAKVIHLPGHSKGSIGILTSDGDFFCGDLLGYNKKPEKGSLIDNKKQFNASIEKLKDFEIKTVYPGHGKPFLMEEFWETQQ